MMKGLIAAAAVSVLAAACTKSMTEYEAAGEIGVFPVTGKMTKIVGGGMETTYDCLESFGVFAYYKQTGEPQEWQDFAAGGNMDTYLDGVEFVYRETGGNWGGGTSNSAYRYDRNINAEDYVKGMPNVREDAPDVPPTPYWWPKTGHLAFAGYSPYKLSKYGSDNWYRPSDDTKINASYSIDEANGYANPGLTISDFTQGEYEWSYNDHWAHNETVDLMWFDVDENMTQSEQSTAMPVIFHHACSWLDFVINTDAAASGEFSIYRVTLGNICRKGTFTSADETWTDLGVQEDIVMFYNAGKKDNSESAGGDHLFCQLDEKGTKLGNLLIIPQDVAKEGVPSVLTIEYKQHTSDSDTWPDYEYDIISGTGPNDPDREELPKGRETLTIDMSEYTAAWETGRHYTYTITFTLDKILIDPSVDNDWQTGSGSGITI